MAEMREVNGEIRTTAIGMNSIAQAAPGIHSGLEQVLPGLFHGRRQLALFPCGQPELVFSPSTFWLAYAWWLLRALWLNAVGVLIVACRMRNN